MIRLFRYRERVRAKLCCWGHAILIFTDISSLPPCIQNVVYSLGNTNKMNDFQMNLPPLSLFVHEVLVADRWLE